MTKLEFEYFSEPYFGLTHTIIFRNFLDLFSPKLNLDKLECSISLTHNFLALVLFLDIHDDSWELGGNNRFELGFNLEPDNFWRRVLLGNLETWKLFPPKFISWRRELSKEGIRESWLTRLGPRFVCLLQPTIIQYSDGFVFTKILHKNGETLFSLKAAFFFSFSNLQIFISVLVSKA